MGGAAEATTSHRDGGRASLGVALALLRRDAVRIDPCFGRRGAFDLRQHGHTIDTAEPLVEIYRRSGFGLDLGFQFLQRHHCRRRLHISQPHARDGLQHRLRPVRSSREPLWVAGFPFRREERQLIRHLAWAGVWSARPLRQHHRHGSRSHHGSDWPSPAPQCPAVACSCALLPTSISSAAKL